MSSASRWSDFCCALTLLLCLAAGCATPIGVTRGSTSPARWAEMINELTHDPTIEGRYQFWMLNDLTIDPGITAHSIIAVLGEGPLTGRTDGVVAYESAHIEGVESEKVVHSGHSTQGHPETIEEVKRILIEHLGRR